jgi:hypothetical protein
MDSSHSLSPLQRELLQAFFEREQRLVLTGGAALAGFHLHHRTSKDLDLFARPGTNLDDVQRALEDAARACSAVLTAQVTYLEFRRFLCTRGADGTLVDLVIDRAPEVDPHKLRVGVIRVDTLREIAANKICTLLGRCEIRDLVDLQALLAAGTSLEDALVDAGAKDRGVNPATLAWLLDELVIGAEAALPGDVAPLDLDAFRRQLVETLRRLAFPS